VSEADQTYMLRALALADSCLGHTWPNPAVGCVIVKDGVVIGEGATDEGGRPHGEEIALAGLGVKAQHATAYIGLEPCARRSAGTSACSDLLIAAGVARVVIGAEDPHPNARGAGIARLRAAGITVETGVCGEAAEALNAGFFLRVTQGRPLVSADADRNRYDAMFHPQPGEALLLALKRLGEAGLTRLCVAPGSPLAEALKKEGLLSPAFRLSA
jgi:diaminohydroxyphosphoribosylaminopyrimidine deaminase/5-amino-6-(5-phosphoribosylamino)uracil reductase